ncbi:MAG: HAD-IIIC family phosphatase [bacterium]|nr:HAD-IIIC family phosphatase [bacterium]
MPLQSAQPHPPDDGAPESALSASARLLEACRQGGDLAAAVEELEMSAPVDPKLAAELGEALVGAGAAPLTHRVLRHCGLESAHSPDVLRVRRACWSTPPSEDHPRLRGWVTGTVTPGPLVPALEVGLLRRGFAPKVACGGFGMLHQDLRDPQGDAVAHAPDFVVMMYDLAGLAPELAQPRRDLSNWSEHVRTGVERLAESMRAWRSRSSATMLLHTLTAEGLPGEGLFNRRRAAGAAAIVAGLNEALAELCDDIDGAYLLDVEGLAAEMGSAAFCDDRRRLFGRFAASADGLSAWGVLAADSLHAIVRGPRKVVVCDLDDTMWGGIVGELGPRGVAVGPDYPGNLFLEFQKLLLDLKAQGVLLALCSKNDPEVGLGPFRDHPSMVLRLGDVAAYRIGWGPKPQAIVELADELNLGLDSFVFLDDSAHERAAVRRALPEVLVPELPADPVDRPRFVRQVRELWPVGLTDTDLRRSEMYQGQARRRRLQADCNGLESFLRSLKQVLTVGPAAEEHWARAAQMHLRTNQFNMTTRRHDEAALRRICAGGGRLFTGALDDRIGDQGVVIVALVIPEERSWRLDTLLMSCRVMGRQVENAMMGYLVGEARRQGIDGIVGEFIPSERNGPAGRFFESMGFDGPEERGQTPGAQWWTLEVAKAELPVGLVEVRRREGVEVQAECVADEYAGVM